MENIAIQFVFKLTGIVESMYDIDHLSYTHFITSILKKKKPCSHAQLSAGLLYFDRICACM